MGLFEDILGGIVAGTGIGAAYPFKASLIRTGLTGGLSANNILGQLSGAGLGMRRQDFYRLVGEIRVGLTAGDWAVGRDPNELPSPGDIRAWNGGTPNKYLTRVNVYVRERLGEGEYEISRRGLSFLSSEAISPAQAVQNAMDMPMTGNYPQQREVLGYEYNGTYFQS